ncbi:putative FBD-associated F-box protein At5g56820 [Lotus japonicus]|uniref:putative FBD-associated F-box protein At5g56820 n=1 Tax=Lotus japonicus TaxID=34305 RepID=UPI00258CB852|nr:putative FBD-associated F-box protein At5g56820 [Lotus japonicus]
MKAYSNVKFLRINQCDVDIPMFPNLIYLELSVGYHVKWSVALDMLNHCPKLQTVVFDLTFDGEDDVWPDPGFVPECFSSHLRKCFLEIFAGLGCEKRFARYVMQNSTLLRTMTISGRYPPNHPKMLEILTELSSYPRSSAVCELLIK